MSNKPILPGFAEFPLPVILLARFSGEFIGIQKGLLSFELGHVRRRSKSSIPFWLDSGIKSSDDGSGNVVKVGG